MEATASRRTLVRPSVLDQALDLSRVNWEMIAYAVLIVVLLGTRFWDLGSRALHHDESIHAYYSFLQYQGQPSAHAIVNGVNHGYDPAYHGPFLYNMVSIAYTLFGVTDATARLMPAIFGCILVLLILLLRPYLGRLGAVFGATMVTLSPSIMYYSRSLRHDIFALTGSFLLWIAILGFIRNHRGIWLYIGALGLGIAYASHELVFVNVAIFVLFLAIAWLWLNFLGAPGDRDRMMEVNPISEALRAVWETQRMALLGAAGLFLAIYALFYSNFMTTPQGLIDGFAQGISYWFLQHGVARGNQPIYYYALLLLPIYEMLAYVAAFATLIVLGVRLLLGHANVPTDLPPDAYPDTLGRTRDDRRNTGLYQEGTDAEGFGLPSAAVMSGLTLAFLAWWSFGALIAYSLAGEKMPWLTMQMALPFTLLAAGGISRLVQNTDWRALWNQGALFMGLLLVLLVFAFLSFVTNLQGLQGAANDILQQQGCCAHWCWAPSFYSWSAAWPGSGCASAAATAGACWR